MRDQEENEIVLNLKTLQETKNVSAGAVWLGGSRASPSSPWQWTDGSDWGWQKWDQGEPNNLQDYENCLEMFVREWVPDGKLGFWNDHFCDDTDYKQPFICEKNKN